MVITPSSRHDGPGIEVEDLSRWFGRGRNRVTALSDVSFTVQRGTVTAMLGVNGAGKTTLTKILSTLLLPSAGRASVLRHDVVKDAKRCRRLTSVVFGGDRGFYMPLTGRVNLAYFAMLAGMRKKDIADRIDGMLDQVGLSDAADRPVETYSKGMLQRLHIAVGLISRPDVLLLDEPTVGLDPAEAQRLRDAVKKVRDDGVTILLTSHLLLDVEELADRVLLLDGGKIRYDMTLNEFIGLAGYVAVITARGDGTAPDTAAFGPDMIVDGHGGSWSMSLKVKEWSPATLNLLSERLETSRVHDFNVAPVRLEDVFATVAGGR